LNQSFIQNNRRGIKRAMPISSAPRDSDIRVALKAWLAATAGPDDYLIEELGLERGQARLDLALVNGSLSGFEIKSDYDNLRRLPSQAERYAKVLDHVTLVAGPKMLATARTHIPHWWGLLVATRQEGIVQFRQARRARANPAKDLRVVVELLWQSEAIDLLEQHGLARGVRGKPRRLLWDRIVEHLDRELVERVIRDRLKARARSACLA
jgi:hypothetical protein